MPAGINMPGGTFGKINKHTSWKMLVKSLILGLFIREKQVKMPLTSNFKLYKCTIPNKVIPPGKNSEN